ncbi:hypothetical protein B9Z55_002526 [Caenorhabditis nigoni]|nr:hypothetical protein B9Z55_002526 [Caenorhabditis nigoni]
MNTRDTVVLCSWHCINRDALVVLALRARLARHRCISDSLLCTPFEYSIDYCTSIDYAKNTNMAGDLLLSIKDNNEYSLDMDESKLQQLVISFISADKEKIRDKAAKNRNFKDFIESARFLQQYARLTGCEKSLPPADYLQKINSEKASFCFKKIHHTFNLFDIVFNKTRHGFGQVDFPIEKNHGVTAIEDVGGCEAPCPLRRVFVLENMNVPVCRFDPIMFCQSWILSVLRPKFVFRGLVACPKGDYGLARFIVEIGNARGATVRSEVSVPFRSGDEEKLGKFLPFEVESPEYNFRPTHVFFFVCIFYVNREQMPIRGMRLANCTVQCVLPKMPESLEGIQQNESFPIGAHDPPPHQCHFSTEGQVQDPDYLQQLKTEFYSVMKNMTRIRAEEVARAESDITALMGTNLLGDAMETDDNDGSDKRKRAGLDNEGEPETKKRC